MKATRFHDDLQVTGVILAGGRSMRFGSHKAFARFQGVPMLARVCQVMVSLFSEVLLVTNAPELYSNLSPVRILTDETPHQGPLGGLCTAMRHARFQRVFVSACDMPLIHESAVREIIRAGGRHEAVIPVANGRKEYLMALYSVGLLPEMITALQRGDLALKSFFANRPGVQWLPMPGNASFNVNTRQQLRDLERRHAE